MCFKFNDSDHKFKKLNTFKKIIIFLFLIRLFYTHNLDCKFNEIFYISLALINIFTYLL
jgi:hypothetical protein